MLHKCRAVSSVCAYAKIAVLCLVFFSAHAHVVMGQASEVNISIKQYGAKGDGVNDDSSAFQSAVNNLPAEGGIVFVPAGQYLIAKQININRDNVAIRGVGNESRLIIKPGPYNTMFAVPSLENYNAQVVKNISFSRLEFDGARVPSQWDSGPNFSKAFFGIWFGQAENVTLSELYMHDWAFEPFTFSNGNGNNRNVLVEKVHIKGSGRNGFHFGQGYGLVTRLVHVEDSPSQQWGPAAGNALDIEVEGLQPIVDGATISDSLFEMENTNTATGGVAIQPAYGPAKNITIERTLLRNYSGGVGIIGAKDNDVSRVRNVTLQDSWVVDDNIKSFRAMLTVQQADTVIAKNNVFNDYVYNAQPSVLIHDSANVTVEGNRLFRPDCPFQLKFGNKQVQLKNNIYSANSCAIDHDATNVGVVTEGNTTTPDAAIDRSAPTAVAVGLAGGQTVSGSMTVSVSAQDSGVGVVRLMYFIDGIPQGVLDAASGSFMFDTTRYPNGPHTVSARAWDKNGNITPVKTVSVQVANQVQAPSPFPLPPPASIPVPLPFSPVPLPPPAISEPTVPFRTPTPLPPAQVPPLSYTHNSLVNDAGTIYLVMGKVKIPFTSMSVFTGLGYKLAQVQTGSLVGYRLPSGGYLLNSTIMSHPWGAFVSLGKTVYVVYEQGLIPITTYDIFVKNGGGPKRVVPANDQDKSLLVQNPNLSPLQVGDARVVGYWQ